MKRVILSILLLSVVSVTAATAQRLVIGERAPEIRVSSWLEGRSAATTGKAVLVNFFHSSNEQCIRDLAKLDGFSRAHSGLNVLVITKETLDKVAPYVSGKGYGFYVGMDEDSKTFNAYGVRFVPFSALLDARGRLVWTGNPGSLTDEIINRALR